MTLWPDPRRHENSLLLCCSRVQADAATRERLAFLLTRKLDWQYVLWQAAWHRITVLLFRQLQPLAAAVPPPVLAHLQEQAKRQTQQSLLQTAGLLQLLPALAAHGVIAVPFKGPALAAAVYGDPALRECEDLDVLVTPHALPQAKAVLVRLGFRPLQPLNRAQEAVYLRYESGSTFVQESTGLQVDLHWAFNRNYLAVPLALADMLPRLQPQVLAGIPLHQLAPEDLLLALCVHGGKHQWLSLNWIIDVAELLRTHPRLAWQDLAARARATGCLRFVHLGLHLAHRLLAAPLPAALREQIAADRVVTQLADHARHRLFPMMEEWDPGVAERILFLLRARERRRDQLRFLLRRLTTPTSSDLFYWQSPLLPAPLYPWLRPARLLFGIVGRGLKFLRPSPVAT
ncbi:MAG: nucleotidyltransferase family protein [candidate division KSB1 bacterium]|nr:nucleotidyltransferase family protein [candidate division KSB1 bacterium]MDZ7276116.1 nucleotidyltransferase family protein [candidate division KSB1 bacterium]MDZ7287104.1 nucleotidyltransferase family protein [candidate division KSB1 bacterium]MDZ7296971.1 nucleotidyltransferase family protein [candidate division KSB1 bacterium]MDZ7306200.1 nucleotidyltransferase family protein [candidate division KSB1 bacterium]